MFKRNTNFKYASPPKTAPMPRVDPVPVYEVDNAGNIQGKNVDKAELHQKNVNAQKNGKVDKGFGGLGPDTR